MLRQGKRSKELMDKQMEVVRERKAFFRKKLSAISSLSYLREYGGCSSYIGTGTCTNSPLVVNQLLFALAANFHPNVTELMRLLTSASSFDKIEKLLIKYLIEGRVFEGIKVLDLGCGWRPPFGRVLRAMGAEVWTVDLNSADVFEVEFHNGGFDQRARDLEVANHIQCDLSFRESAELILTRTGGKLDLVSSAHLHTEWRGKGPLGVGDILAMVLREFGVYYEAHGDFEPEIFLGGNRFLEYHERWNHKKKEYVLESRISSC